MVQVRFAKNSQGQDVFTTPSTGWQPLEHGKSTFTNENGQQFVWDAQANDFLPVANLWDNLKSGTNDVILSGQAILNQLGLVSDTDLAKSIQNPLIPTRATQHTPEYNAALEDYNTNPSILGGIKAIAGNPIDVGLPMLEESIPGMAATLLPAVATGGLSGVVEAGALGTAKSVAEKEALAPLIAAARLRGAVVGTAVGSMGVNQGSKYNEVIQGLAQQRGVDISDPNTYAAFVNSRLPDGSLVKDVASNQATAYSIPVAASDALSLGLSGPAESIIKGALEKGSVGRAMGAALGSTGVQGVMGAGGEALGQLNQKGQIYDPMSVVAEGALEAVGAPGEILGVHLMRSGLTAEQAKAIIDTPLPQDEEPMTSADIRMFTDFMNKTGTPLKFWENADEATIKRVVNRLKLNDERNSKEALQAKYRPTPKQDRAIQNQQQYLLDQLVETPEYKNATPEQKTFMEANVKRTSPQPQNYTLDNPVNPTTPLLAEPAATSEQTRAGLEAVANLPIKNFEGMTPLQWKALTEGVTSGGVPEGPVPANQVSKVDEQRIAHAKALVEAKLAKNPKATPKTITNWELQAAKKAVKAVPTPPVEETVAPSIFIGKGRNAKATVREESPIGDRSMKLGPAAQAQQKTTAKINREAVKAAADAQKEAELLAAQLKAERTNSLVRAAQASQTPNLSEAEKTTQAVNAFRQGIANPETEVPNRYSPAGAAQVNQSGNTEAIFSNNRLPGAERNRLPTISSSSTPLTPEVTTERLQRTNEAIAKFIERTKATPDKITINTEQSPTLDKGALGSTKLDVITLAALQEGDPMETLNHELLHALLNTGLLTTKEYSVLRKMAIRDKWKDKHHIEEYYSDKTEEEKIEEAIAEELAERYTRGTEKPNTPIGKLLAYLKSWFDYAKAFIGGVNDTKANEILDSILNGTVGSREVKPEWKTELERARLRSMDRRKTAEAIDNANPDKIEVLKSVAKLNWGRQWFYDPAAVASKFALFRPYFTAVRQKSELHHRIRQMMMDGVKFFHDKHYTTERKKALNTAAAYLAINDEEVKFPPKDATKWTITLNRDYKQFGKSGDTVTIEGREIEDIKTLQKMYRTVGEMHAKSLVAHGIANILGKVDKFIQLNMASFIEKNASIADIRKYASTIKLSTEEKEDIETFLDVIQSQIDQLKHFYIPQMRGSEYFVDFVDTSDLDKNGNPKRIAVNSLPTGLLGSKPTERAQRAFISEKLAELKKTNPGVKALKPRQVGVGKNWNLSESHIDAFERMAMSLENADSPDVREVLAEIRREFGTRGYKAQWVPRKDVPGWIHKGNVENYVEASAALYASKAGRGISNSMYYPVINKAIGAMRTAVGQGDLDKSVLDYAIEHDKYLNSSANEAAKIRRLTSLWFLGASPSTAVLNTFQLLHSSLPVLVAMFGNPVRCIGAISAAIPMASKFIKAGNWMDSDFFVAERPEGVPVDVWNAIQEMKNDGTVRQIITEELSAKGASERGVIGSNSKRNQFDKALDRVGGVDGLATAASAMFSRTETLVRIATAIAAFNLHKNMVASKDMVALKKYYDYIDTTQFADESMRSSKDTAKFAVELSQFDTTKYNKSPMFRGVMAVPTQFLAFPAKMVQLYMDLLRNAIGYRDEGGTFHFDMTKASTKAAFTTMIMGLMFTSGVFGAIPLGEAGKDLWDKLYQQLTGIDPNIEEKLREITVDATGSTFLADSMASGMFGALTDMDIHSRVGLQMLNTFNPSVSVLDMLGPTGGIVGEAGQAFTSYNQGQTLLAASHLMPTLVKNILKAYNESEYGIVTQAGNVVPSDYNPYETVLQGLGFTPQRLTNTRDIIFNEQRLTGRTQVLAERYQDQLVALQVRAQEARLKNDPKAAQDYLSQYRDLMKSIMEMNKDATPSSTIRINMRTLQRRIAEQKAAATRGIISLRRTPKEVRPEGRGIPESYGSSYVSRIN